MPYESWTSGGVAATARSDVAAAVRAALTRAGTLYAWAARQPGRDTFHGRGAAYGVTLGLARAVVRHARHGGWLAPLLGDRYWGVPRFEREIALSERLRALGVATPAVLAGVRYDAGALHRADVATERVPGVDLVALLFGEGPPAGAAREALWTAVGRLVGRLHASGFVHSDLQLRNVVYDPSVPGVAASLLDVDTCREVGTGSDGGGERRRNLGRFYRSWGKWNDLRGGRLTSRDKVMFEDAYRDALR